MYIGDAVAATESTEVVECVDDFERLLLDGDSEYEGGGGGGKVALPTTSLVLGPI